MSDNNIIELFHKAVTLHQAGDVGAAVSLYRKILSADARNARVLGMLGLACVQQEDWDEGIRLMQASLDVSSGQPDILNNLGYSLQLLGRHDEALENYARAIALQPNYVSAYYNQGNALHDMGRYDEAVASFRKAISLRPDYVDAHVNLGNSLKELSRYVMALASYDQATVITPFRADIHYNRGLVLHELGRYDEALASYDQAISLKPDFAEVLNSRGLLLQDLRRYEEALSDYERAIAINPELAEAYNNLGLLYVELDRGDDAEACLTQAIRINPNCGAAYHNLVLRDPLAYLGQLETLYAQRAALPLNDRIYLDFALGQAQEKRGEYGRALQAYEEGNRLYHLAHPVDESAEEDLLDWITSFFTRELFDKYAGIPDPLPSAGDEKVPVFIVGMPRSGTTLIEQVLSSHSSLYGAGELKTLDEIIRKVRAFPHDSADWATSLSYLRQMGQDYLASVWKLAPDVHYITDKMPANYRYLGLIHLMLPNAKIIHSMRDPLDVCFSCYALRFKEGHEYSYDLKALGRHYLRYRKLMDHWRSVLPSGCILDVHYESMVANLEEQSRRLLEYIGLPWDPACLKFYENKRAVSTASVTQVRKPIYSSSMARWKHFEQHLAPLIEIIHS